MSLSVVSAKCSRLDLTTLNIAECMDMFKCLLVANTH